MSASKNTKSIGIVAMPKPFKDHIAVIQRNSVSSWTKLVSPDNIVLCGIEEGCAETAFSFGTKHMSEVARNDYGTPLLSDLFRIGECELATDLICFVNSDIMFTSKLLKAVFMVSRRWSKFLLVGRRTNLDLREPWGFNLSTWESALEEKAQIEGELFTPDGIDYFIFPRGLWGEIPPFAIGRPAFDNWLIYRARALRVPVIDATKMVTAVHQNHDYSHAGGKTAVWEGPEATRNRELAGWPNHVFDIGDATWVLTSDGLKRALTKDHSCQRLRRLPELYPCLGGPFKGTKLALDSSKRFLYRVRCKLLTPKRGKN